MAQAGVASRRKCEELIFEGRVKVNGKQVLVPQTSVDPEKDHIEVEGRKITLQEKKVYFLLNKPIGYLCTATRIKPTSKLVLDLFEGFPYRLFTVGRLDRDTTGLIILTNDGHFAHQLMHPSFGITKEYLVKTYEEIKPEHLEELRKGGFIEGAKVVPQLVSKVRRGTLKIVLGEGRKREVRQLVEGVGLTILTLTRIRIGSLLLGNLPEGAFRELSLKEVESLRTTART
jgi:23S rRNA pseudouridine2605 synthase